MNTGGRYLGVDVSEYSDHALGVPHCDTTQTRMPVDRTDNYNMSGREDMALNSSPSVGKKVQI